MLYAWMLSHEVVCCMHSYFRMSYVVCLDVLIRGRMFPTNHGIYST